MTPSIETKNLSYKFPNSGVGLFDISLCAPQGSRILLVGPNGAGKSTLLKILAGQKMIQSGSILLNGVDPFKLELSASKKTTGNVIYLGTEWANNEIVKRDIAFTVLINSIGGDLYPERRDFLIDLLDIDIRWRMNQCSDGERRRVQLCMGLLKPWDILLLDEVTVDLDVLVRNRLLQFLVDETTSRGSSVVYATHIFDGLGDWPSRIVHMRGGCLIRDVDHSNINFRDSQKEVVQESSSGVDIAKVASLHPLALKWLHTDLELRGERSQDKTRPRWEDLEIFNEKSYYNSERVTDYFKSTRK